MKRELNYHKFILVWICFKNNIKKIIYLVNSDINNIIMLNNNKVINYLVLFVASYIIYTNYYFSFSFLNINIMVNKIMTLYI